MKLTKTKFCIFFLVKTSQQDISMVNNLIDVLYNVEYMVEPLSKPTFSLLRPSVKYLKKVLSRTLRLESL